MHHASPLRAALAIAMIFMLSPCALAADSVEVLAVSASSTDGMLMNAVDGDPTTAWHNKHEGERVAWLAVRFASSATVRGIRLDTGPMPSDVVFDVETSSDGLTYRPALQNKRITRDGLNTFPFESTVSALYLRVRFRYTGGGVAPRDTIKELEAIPG